MEGKSAKYARIETDNLGIVAGIVLERRADGHVLINYGGMKLSGKEMSFKDIVDYQRTKMDPTVLVNDV